MVSAWELVLKMETGKLKLPEPVSVYVPTRMAHYGIESLEVTLQHVLRCDSLPLLHRDPFDRLLIAQSLVEEIPILTADPQFPKYSIEVLW